MIIDPNNQIINLKKVLLVDDSKSQRITLSALLKKSGYEVLIAEDGFEALEIIKQGPPPFIISDWVMPGMSGPELCRQIRQIYPDGNIYLILLTSKTDKADVSAGLHAGADDFLSKPLHKEELDARMVAGLRILKLQQNLLFRNDQLDRTHKQLSSIHEKLEDDLKAAAILQQVYIPRNFTNFSNGKLQQFTNHAPISVVTWSVIFIFPTTKSESIQLMLLDTGSRQRLKL